MQNIKRSVASGDRMQFRQMVRLGDDSRQIAGCELEYAMLQIRLKGRE